MINQVSVVIEQLRRMADELEADSTAQVGDFDVSHRLNGNMISQDLRITVYHEPTKENLCTVFGVDAPSTLDEQMIP